MKATSKLILLATSLLFLYDTASHIYKVSSMKYSSPKTYTTPGEYGTPYEDTTCLDTLSIPVKPFLVIDTVGRLSSVSDGYVEVIRPASQAMNNKLVLPKYLAERLVLTPSGDTLFVTVKAKEKGFDLKVYASGLQGVVCRSNHYLSLVGIEAPRFYVKTVQEEIGMYDSCRIGHLVTDSNRFRFVNECMIDEFSALDNKSFRYDLTKGCLIRSHSYASK